MKKIALACLVLVLFLASSLFSNAVSAEEDIEVELSVVESDPRYHEDKSILVAGMWNNLEVTMSLDKPRDLRVVLFKGDTTPQNKNYSNYYEWKYIHDSDNHWESMVEYNNFSYIDVDKCKKSENIYTFCVGISDTLPNTPFYKDEWKMEIYENNDKIYSEYFYLEKPTKGIAKSHGDIIYFYVDPFTEMVAPGTDFFTLKNTGNVPLDVSMVCVP